MSMMDTVSRSDGGYKPNFFAKPAQNEYAKFFILWVITLIYRSMSEAPKEFVAELENLLTEGRGATQD